ncbi:MAG: hypothetical protein KF704_06285 [Crocinitomicaceae bacterium]|nr:hypothetical protein [Crocinitomicaceae bacterium]NGF75848.1 hypothetical protein [Fluviicola sp. SGL-29]
MRWPGKNAGRAVAVNWLLGLSSRNAMAVKKAKSAWQHIFALIFWFFCIKAKEQIDKLVSASIEKCGKKPGKAHSHFLYASERHEIKIFFLLCVGKKN